MRFVEVHDDWQGDGAALVLLDSDDGASTIVAIREAVGRLVLCGTVARTDAERHDQIIACWLDQPPTGVSEIIDSRGQLIGRLISRGPAW